VKYGTAWRLTAWVVLLAMSQAVSSGGQTGDAGALDPAILGALLGRAEPIAPGTYVVTAGALAPAEALPLFVQADAYRGPGRTTRVAIALAATVPRGTAVRMRISRVGAAPGPSSVIPDATAVSQEGALRLVREFTLSPGEYDVHALVGHPRAAGGFVASLSRLRLTVPDVWMGSLAVTPIVLGESASDTARTPDPRAFIFGPTALTPASRNVFAQDGDLQLAFRVFNWKAEPGQKPDLTAEYTFYQQTARRLAFFNKIKPQKLNADALGEGFDAAPGVVSAGMRVPLQSFPYGEFQVKVRITDNGTRQSAERQARFVVAP
jgi:hypothetical protein